MTYKPSDIFVPNGDSRRDTAILLVGTARDAGLSDRHVHASNGGFYISEELADLLYADPDAEEAQESKSTKKTSGNRAAKNTPEEE